MFFRNQFDKENEGLQNVDTQDNLTELIKESMMHVDTKEDISDIHFVKEEDIQEENIDQKEDPEDLPKRKGRGPETDWDREETYENPSIFNVSTRRKEIDTFLTRRRRYDTFAGRMEHYVCKFSKKTWFKRCPVELKVCYIATSFEIVVFYKNLKHIHEEDLSGYLSLKFHYTQAQRDIIEDGIQNFSSNNRILNNLKEAGASTNGQYPTMDQLLVKKRNMKLKLKKTEMTLGQEPGRRGRGRPPVTTFKWQKVASFPCLEEWQVAKEHQELEQFFQKQVSYYECYIIV